MAYKLDIFGLLSKIDKKSSGDIYQNLSDDEKKGFQPLVIMRWMSGTSDQRQLMLLNTFANRIIFSLSKHPHLLMQVLQVCSSKVSKRYSWLGINSTKKNTETLNVIAEYFEMSKREAKLYYPIPSNTELIQMAEELGYDKDNIKKLNNELSGK